MDLAKEWLEDARHKMMLVFSSPASGFAPASHELYMDLAAFGTGCMLIEDGVRFRTFHLAEIFPVENQAGQIDTVYRRFSCPECDESHWRIFSDGSIQCIECDLILDSHLVVEVTDNASYAS